MRTRSRQSVLAAVCAVTVLASACDLNPRTATLPGGVATGSDGYTVTARFTDVDNLVDNAEVLYRDVRIGTVRSIDADPATWQAKVRLSLEKKLRLPSNVTATIGQKSLLGAEYVQIDDPAAPAATSLADGDAIPIARTAQYPATEDVLAATSMLLNYGGLSQINTITTQLNAALRGRTGVARDLITQLSTFVGRLNDQRGNLVDAIDRLNDLGAQLADNRDTVAKALTQITPAVATLNSDRSDLTTALAALDKLSTVATGVIARNKQGLATDLALLRPAVTKLAEAGSAVPRSLPLLATFPFPVSTIDRAVRGDYMNVYVTLDLTTPTVSRDFGLDAKDSSLAENSATLQEILNTVLGSGNPLTIPLRNLPAAKSSPAPTKPGAAGPGGTTATPPAGSSSTSPAPAPSSGAGSGGSSGGCNGLASLLGRLTGGC